MRPRNKKNLNKRLLACDSFIEKDPSSRKGRWAGDRGSVRVEIGCGKGDFITGLAERHPEVLFVGIECVGSVLVTAAEKAMSAGLGNVVFIQGNALYMADYFDRGEIDEIYLNFSDPWPKERNRKNRLTGETFMPIYVHLLKDGGLIRQKTDNRPLFDFSLETYESFGCVLEEVSFDLHNESYYAGLGNVLTEYEKRFSEAGTPICYAKVRMPARETVKDRIDACLEGIRKRREYESRFSR
ncbi:MAG: tRNA (guanosine(46)-N7)-methyltransferase TrmB [Clostridia bacterium]|nr:tRNA (guanosine(46)-N7)-methyltransferase TrmB [Clostridia bacterium]